MNSRAGELDKSGHVAVPMGKGCSLASYTVQNTASLSPHLLVTYLAVLYVLYAYVASSWTGSEPGMTAEAEAHLSFLS